MANELPGDGGLEEEQPNQGGLSEGVENTVKDPDQWKTGDEPITGAQASYLSTLAEGAGKAVDTSNMTKAEASKAIDELQDEQGS